MRRGGWGRLKRKRTIKDGGSDASVFVLRGCMGFSKIVIASAVVGWVERSETHQCFREDDGFRYALPILPTKHDFAPSGRDAPESLMNFPPRKGAGNAGCRCTRSRAWCVVNTRVSHHESTGTKPGIPARNGFNGFLRAPRRSGFLVTVACDAATRKLDASVEASGPHDFSVHARRCSSVAPPASTASRPASVTIASRPCLGRDGGHIQLIWVGRSVISEIQKLRAVARMKPTGRREAPPDGAIRDSTRAAKIPEFASLRPGYDAGAEKIGRRSKRRQ
jgi:hypothetical protein